MEDYVITGFGQVLLFLVGGTLFLSISLLLARLVRPNRPNQQKLETYESGEQPVQSAWSQFNARFYIIALIFILFEVEIVFLFPWATVFADDTMMAETNGAWGWFSLTEMIIFILVLALGLAYAWVNGLFDWVKPAPKIEDMESPVPPEKYDHINRKYA